MTHQRVLVTGGAGFLGSHLCDQLIEKNHDVIALDDFSTSVRDNVSHLVGHPRFTLVEHDVREPYDFEVQQIYNLACPASPIHYQRNPVKTVLTNVLGTLNGLRLAQKRKARFLQASTSEIYGDPDVHPQPENYQGNVNPIGPRACYDEGKRCAETLVMDFHRQYGVDVRLARIFNTYGPRMAFDDGRVISNFIIQALRGLPITIYGNGSQTRSFCYVDDLAHGLVSLMEHPSEIGPVNLGNPGEFTMKELASLVLEATQSSSQLSFRTLPTDDPKQRKPDISKAQQCLGFKPTIPLKAGLQKTITDFRTRLG